MQDSSSAENFQDSSETTSNSQNLNPSSKIIFNISIDGFRQLVTSQVDLNQLFILESISLGIDINSEIKSSKIAAWYQSLFRKGYISADNQITQLGKELLDMVVGNKDIKRELSRLSNIEESGFDKWWKAYPANDGFEYKGTIFQGSRGLRTEKTDCRAIFGRIISEGEYTVDDLIRALNYEVALKKEVSIKERQNKMSYMSGTGPYLRQRKFENFIDISKTAKLPDTNSNQYSGFDI